MSKQKIVVSGKRKTAVARVSLTDGKGLLTYNGVPSDHLSIFHRLALIEPIRLAEETVGKVEVTIRITARGGGKEGQIQAARLAIAKALVMHFESPELKKALLKYDRNLLVADTRRKETYKPGDSKARARRQKSYR